MLAAALRYQLGGEDKEAPTYAAVLIDEALANSDASFSETVIRIFQRFGFQLILATPMKSIMTIEPFIGGASYVEKHDDKFSSAFKIEYDEKSQRLSYEARPDEQAISA